MIYINHINILLQLVMKLIIFHVYVMIRDNVLIIYFSKDYVAESFNYKIQYPQKLCNEISVNFYYMF